jgi:hypothetical protein
MPELRINATEHWRGWPQRVFALAAETPGVQARFRRVSVAMAALIAGAFVVGVAAAHLPYSGGSHFGLARCVLRRHGR